MRTKVLTPMLLLAAALLSVPAASDAAVEQVPVGVLFTYTSADAGKVTLAGTFNGWDAERNPLNRGDDGVWRIAMAMKPGLHEYKFVVDGSWFHDAENPRTQQDPYGGVNSVVEVDERGRIVAAPAAEAAVVLSGPNTPWNAKLRLEGRYLGRYTAYKNFNDDPRFRMERPEQRIDLNFHTEVSDVVDAYTRLRLDNTTDINMNSISAELDEGSVDVHPGPFRVLGYWDMEVLELDDPLSSGGDLDLAGTLLDDHLRAGKGTGGVTIEGSPFGATYRGFFADVHDADYYNSLEIYDNSGRDVFGSRLSKAWGPVEIGLPLSMQRELVWTDMSDRVGSPEGTGIPALDAHLARTSDTSTWYEWENMDLRLGVDAGLELAEGQGRLQVEWLRGTLEQRFATGNAAGFNSTNGPVELDLLTRDRDTYHASFDWDFREGTRLNMEHTLVNETGAAADETYGDVFFQHQDEADKRVYLEFTNGRPGTSWRYSEFTVDNARDGARELLWLQRLRTNNDYGAVGLTAPFSGLAKAATTVNTVTALVARGLSSDRLGAWELTGAWTHRDDEIDGLDGQTYELIARWTRDLTPEVEALVDLRVKRFRWNETSDAGVRDLDGDYWSPYFGVRYKPHRKLDVVCAWGVDPLSFGIDYQGRNIGRWLVRERWKADHPEATELDAERALEDLKAIGVRANFIF